MTGSNPQPLLCVPVIAATDTLMVKAWQYTSHWGYNNYDREINRAQRDSFEVSLGIVGCNRQKILSFESKVHT